MVTEVVTNGITPSGVESDSSLVAVQDGRLVTLVLTEVDGTVVGRQPLWVGWKYDAAGIIGAYWRLCQ